MNGETSNMSEIIKALHVIKSVCSEHSKCCRCPFYTDDACRIKNNDPEKWKLASQYIWRAFE
mgnify:CR=1 FL=1